jgi:uncharacterized metal-binding protein YceD (DUF177 family)
MQGLLKIHTEQLNEEKREEINLTLPPDFLDVKEDDLYFPHPIHVKGETYVITDHLVLLLTVKTQVQMPCSICNKKISVPLETQDISHTLPLAEMESTIFDYTDLLREEIILLIPLFAECENGKCPERDQIAKFMKKKAADPAADPTQNFPFADL